MFINHHSNVTVSVCVLITKLNESNPINTSNLYHTSQAMYHNYLECTDVIKISETNIDLNYSSA